MQSVDLRSHGRRFQQQSSERGVLLFGSMSFSKMIHFRKWNIEWEFEMMKTLIAKRKAS